MVDSTPIDYATATKHTGKGPDRVYSLSEKQKFVSENAVALALVKKGIGEPYCNPPLRSASTRFPYYSGFRSLARLLALKASLEANSGRYDEAVQTGLDAVEMGCTIPRGGTAIAGMVGIAIESIGRRHLWEYAAHLSPAEARNAATRLERIRARRFAYWQTLQEEKWAAQAAMLEMLRAPTAAQDVGELIWEDDSGQQQSVPPPFAAFSGNLFFMAHSKRAIVDGYTRYMDQEILRNRAPYASAGPPIPIPRNAVIEAYAISAEQARLKATVNDAQDGMLQTALALQAFRGEHGAYPAALAELTPGYMASSIADPFGRGQPLGYRRTGSTFVLYSVGPDGVDDGGRPIDHPEANASSPSARYMVNIDSKGDIVAGKNP